MKKKQIIENIIKGEQPKNPMLSDEWVNDGYEESQAIADKFDEREFIKEAKKMAKKIKGK